MIEAQKLSVTPAARESGGCERSFCRNGCPLPETVSVGLNAEYASDCHGCGELSVSVDELYAPLP